MNKEELLPLLKQAGLNSYEAGCYLALLQFKNLTAGECARISKIPPTKSHITLQSLEERGLISHTNDKPMKFLLIPANEGILKYIEGKKSSIENIQDMLRKNLEKISFEEKSIEPTEKIIIKSGREGQHELALSFPKTAQKEIMIISSGEKLPYRLLQESKRAIDRGVKIRYIITKIRGNESLISQLKSLGYLIRHSNIGHLFIAVKDSKESLLIIKDPKNAENRISILILDENLSRAHAKYFNEVWKKSKTI